MTIMAKPFYACLVSLSLIGCGGGDDTSHSSSTTSTDTIPVETTMDDQFGLYLNDLANNHILPGYQQLAQNAEVFSSYSQQFCLISEPTLADLTTLQGKWLQLTLQWQQVQWIKTGPIIDNNRLLRMQYWPDSNNAIERGITNLLLEQQTVDAAFVANHNAGGQGIPAAERLLFTSTDSQSLLSANDSAKRCEVLSAIATNLSNISVSLYQAWQPDGGNYIKQLTQGSGDFSNRQDAVEELIGNWLEQLEHVKDEKILTPLWQQAPGQPLQAEFYVSDHSLKSIKTNISIFEQLYTGGNGFGLDDILANHLEQVNIDNHARSSLLLLTNKAELLNGHFSEMLAHQTQRQQLTELIAALQDFRSVMNTDIVQALDIYIGFNSSDGD